jgi:DNA-binding CsgD family transcriptional regulator
MDYKKIYNNLMETRLSIKNERLQLKKNGEYFEGHHIIPKSKGGTGDSTRPKNNPNIVVLTAREHFLAHWLLWRIYRDRQSALAFHKMMSTTKNIKRITSSRGYEEAREAFRLTNIGNQYGKGVKKVVSEEQKKKQSQIMKGRYIGEKNPFYGKTHSDETREKLRKSREGMINEKVWSYKGEKVVIKNNEVVGIFKSSKEIANFIGCSDSNIKNTLSGNQKTAGGYQIKHFNEYYKLLS